MVARPPEPSRRLLGGAMHSRQGRGAQILLRGHMVPPSRQRRLTLFAPPRPIHSSFTPRRTFFACWRRRPTRTATLLRSAGGSTSRAEPRCACSPRPNDGARFWRCWARGPVPWGMGGGRGQRKSACFAEKPWSAPRRTRVPRTGERIHPGLVNQRSMVPIKTHSHKITLLTYKTQWVPALSPSRHPSHEKSVLRRPGAALAPPTLTHKANGAAR